MPTNNAILSDQEKARIYYHMGYGLVNVASLFTLGVPAVSQPLYIVYSSVEHIPDTRIQMFREVIAALDRIDAAFLEAIDYFPASQLGEITVNPQHTTRLDEEYYRWANRLAEMLIAPLNPYSTRFGGGSRSMNRRVLPT